MPEVYDVEVTVKSIKGKCPFKYKVGDKILFDGRAIKGDICYSALLTLLPTVHAMRYGIVYPWMTDKNIETLGCHDWENLVVFELKRTKK